MTCMACVIFLLASIAIRGMHFNGGNSLAQKNVCNGGFSLIMALGRLSCLSLCHLDMNNASG